MILSFKMTIFLNHNKRKGKKKGKRKGKSKQKLGGKIYLMNQISLKKMKMMKRNRRPISLTSRMSLLSPTFLRAHVTKVFMFLSNFLKLIKLNKVKIWKKLKSASTIIV